MGVLGGIQVLPYTTCVTTVLKPAEKIIPPANAIGAPIIAPIPTVFHH
ncbi:hypothetical protein [Methanobacterium petrolearium]|nr:hypothetical protein [Methanobacterium petrolearium]MBP1947070.1 hypothetical protein [Methanobacterium petrolearium]